MFSQRTLTEEALALPVPGTIKKVKNRVLLQGVRLQILEKSFVIGVCIVLSCIRTFLEYKLVATAHP